MSCSLKPPVPWWRDIVSSEVSDHCVRIVKLGCLISCVDKGHRADDSNRILSGEGFNIVDTPNGLLSASWMLLGLGESLRLLEADKRPFTVLHGPCSVPLGYPVRSRTTIQDQLRIESCAILQRRPR